MKRVTRTTLTQVETFREQQQKALGLFELRHERLMPPPTLGEIGHAIGCTRYHVLKVLHALIDQGEVKHLSREGKNTIWVLARSRDYADVQPTAAAIDQQPIRQHTEGPDQGPAVSNLDH